MPGQREVQAIFARLFEDDALRLALLRAGDDDARRTRLRNEGFPGEFTIADVRAEARRLLATGHRPSSRERAAGAAWEPGPGQLWADAPFGVKTARRAAIVFGRLAATACREPATEPVAPTIRAGCAVVGTVKGGTSALHHFLSQHPEICMAPHKETHFFCRDLFFESGAPQAEWYSLTFLDSFSGQAVVGEATPDYMYHPAFAERAAAYNPDMKLILVLRNPVARAYSDYCMRSDRQMETRTFAAAIGEEAAMLARGEEIALSEDEPTLRYVAPGFYMRFIEALLEHFPREQLLLLRTDELREEHEATLKKVYAFLGVGPVPVPEARLVMQGSGRPMEAADKARLLDLFEEPITDLEVFTGWDLRRWRE